MVCFCLSSRLTSAALPSEYASHPQHGGRKKPITLDPEHSIASEPLHQDRRVNANEVIVFAFQ